MFSSINSFLKYASLYIYWVIDFLNHALPSNSPPRLPWPLSGIHLPQTLKRRLHQPDMRKLWHCRQLIRVKWRLDLDRFPASLARGRVRASESGTPIRLDPTKKTTKTMTRLWEKVALSSRCNPLQCLVDIDTASLANWNYSSDSFLRKWSPNRGFHIDLGRGHATRVCSLRTQYYFYIENTTGS